MYKPGIEKAYQIDLPGARPYRLQSNAISIEAKVRKDICMLQL